MNVAMHTMKLRNTYKMRNRQQYTCPECGTSGVGSPHIQYVCHICDYRIVMLPSHNGKILTNKGNNEMKPFEYIVVREQEKEFTIVTDRTTIMAHHEGHVKMEAVRNVDKEIPSNELKVYVRPFV